LRGLSRKSYPKILIDLEALENQRYFKSLNEVLVGDNDPEQDIQHVATRFNQNRFLLEKLVLADVPREIKL
jgi:hypothetical protein